MFKTIQLKWPLLALFIVVITGLQNAWAIEPKPKPEPVPVVDFEKGKYYKTLDKPIVGATAPIMEFFYFGCKTCYQLVPALAQWSHETGIGVTLVPVHSDNAMVDAARLYHTFAEMNVLSRMYELGYVIFQTDKSELKGEARINDYLERHRVNKERFWKIWNSDKVNKRLAGSLALTQQAKIYKTPTFLVKGRYMVNIDAITHVEHLFQLLEYLNKKPD